MGLTTDIIRYNVNDRRRKYGGTTRRFNVQKFMTLVNGNRVQEMVRKGDMFGYLGHDIRREFGLNPPEVAMSGGSIVPIEPAFVTTYIKVSEDGTVEHQARFLDTPLGKKAQEWHESGAGGFSSVVAPNEENPVDFWGFDYVLSPNFHGNRGYAVMDSAAYDFEMSRLTSKQKYLEIEARQKEQQAVMDALFQTARNQGTLLRTNDRLNASLDCIAQQYEEAQQEIADLRYLLAQNEAKHAPALRLSVSEDNWLTTSLASMDSIRQNPVSDEEPGIVQNRTLQYLRSV